MSSPAKRKKDQAIQPPESTTDAEATSQQPKKKKPRIVEVEVHEPTFVLPPQIEDNNPLQQDTPFMRPLIKQNLTSDSSILKFAGFSTKSKKNQIPRHLTDKCHVVDEENFEVFSSLLLETAQVTFGAIWTDDNTNYRLSNGKNLEFETTLVGFFFCEQIDDGIYFLPMLEDDPAKWDFIKRFVEEDSLKKICFNAQLVLRPILERLPEASPSNLVDPVIASWLFQSEWKSYSLVEIAYNVLEKLAVNRIQTNVEYLADDTFDCNQIWKEIEEILEDLKLTKPFQFEMKIVPILTKMEIVGVGFDPNSFSKNRTLLTKQLAALGNEAEKIIGHPVLLTSPQQVAKAIYDELKLSSSGKSKLTPSGKQSTNEAALVKLKHPFVDIVLAYRQIAKYLSSWLDPSSLAKHALHENFRDHDNPGKELRIHASWLQNGTATGRLACKEPNLQNLPREPLKVRIESDDIFVTVRNAIRAKEGYTLIGSDYSQIEMRILAHMTGDKKLKQFFEEGRDIHLLISSHALGKSIDKVTPQERASFKQVVFGILYGMGSKTLSEILKVSLREAQQFIDAFLGKFPTVRNFIQTTQKNAKEKSEIRTLLGRRRCIDFSEPGKGERQSVNSVIQGSAADVIKIAMIKIDEAISKDEHGCKDCRLVLQLHDELVYEVPIDKVDGMKKLLKQYMEGAISLNVPLTSTVEEGPYWGEMTECKKDN